MHLILFFGVPSVPSCFSAAVCLSRLSQTDGTLCPVCQTQTGQAYWPFSLSRLSRHVLGRPALETMRFGFRLPALESGWYGIVGFNVPIDTYYCCCCCCLLCLPLSSIYQVFEQTFALRNHFSDAKNITPHSDNIHNS